MGDVIYRQDAIDALHNYWRKRLDTLPTKKTEDGEVYADTKSVNKILEYNKALTNFIKDLPSAQQWIPCSERLPEQYSDVLCCDNHGEYMIGMPFVDDDANTGFCVENDGMYMLDCIAWMPLPEPYKEEK